MKNKIEVSVIIKATTESVWKGLTDPELVKQYFFGTNLVSSWMEGSPIFFRGEWEGRPYEDKGMILSIRPGTHVSYSYWSSMSGVPDCPENYHVITYDLSSKEHGTEVVVTQETTPEMQEHSERNWRMLLAGLKKLIETMTFIEPAKEKKYIC